MKNLLLTSCIFALGLTSILAGCQNKPDAQNNLDILKAQMAPADNPSAKGMVAAANPHAAQAGIEALRAGGSAVDAAIAIQAVLGLVEPQSSGVAGGAFLVFYDAATGKVTAYNGREKAPGLVDENLFMGEDGTPMRRLEAIISGKSTGVPGVMAMLDMAHKDHGKLAWADNFNFGIKLAETGFEVSPRLAGFIKMASKYGLTIQPETRDYFFHEDGTPLQVGDIRDNKPYAQSLRAIAADARAMYVGPLAEKIVATVSQEPRPGLLSLEDMKAYTPTKSEALCTPYRDAI